MKTPAYSVESGLMDETCELHLTAMGLSGSHVDMKSRLADEARRRLNEDLRRMSPEQRLAAYARHCQLMAQVRRAGGASVRGNPRPAAADAH